MGDITRARATGSLLLGCAAWTICLLGQEKLTGDKVFAWVADRDAGCVVALDSELRELEIWVIPKPTELVVDGDGVLVRSSFAETSEWSRLERRAPPKAHIFKSPADLRPTFVDPAFSLVGEPTAAVRAGDHLLVATPGAVHLFKGDGGLALVQGGFSWISAVALTASSVHSAD